MGSGILVTTKTEKSLLRANANPRVSVIIPFFNPGNFLREAVESVVAQTYRSWELILVDDGSTDHSTSIAKAFAAASEGCIRYLEHPGHANRGMPASRNFGIISSCGAYVANLDADDWWEAGFLDELVSVLDSNPSVAMTFGPMKVWGGWSEREKRADWVQSFTFVPNKIIQPPSFIPLLLTGRNDPQGCVFRREILDEVGLYEESLEMCEDWALFIKIALKNEIMPIGNCLYRYRQHPGQFCRQRHVAGSFHRDFLPFISWLRHYLESVSCEDRGVWVAVRRLAWRNRILRAREVIISTLRRVWP